MRPTCLYHPTHHSILLALLGKPDQKHTMTTNNPMATGCDMAGPTIPMVNGAAAPPELANAEMTPIPLTCSCLLMVRTKTAAAHGYTGPMSKPIAPAAVQLDTKPGASQTVVSKVLELTSEPYTSLCSSTC